MVVGESDDDELAIVLSRDGRAPIGAAVAEVDGDAAIETEGRIQRAVGVQARDEHVEFIAGGVIRGCAQHDLAVRQDQHRRETRDGGIGDTRVCDPVSAESGIEVAFARLRYRTSEKQASQRKCR